jgi:hypothetical protein
MTESIETRALRWASGDGTGVSSKAILKVMTKNYPKDGYCYPHDGGDLGRCILLLALIPEWRARIGEMRAVGPEWSALVDHWDELEALYYKDDNRGLIYKRMKEILDPIEAKRAGLVKIGDRVTLYTSPRRDG